MDKLERVARAMCAAEGKAPDDLVWTGSFDSKKADQPPNWHRYVDEAKRFIAAFEAMRAVDLEPLA